jgi:hypothetical protein
VFQLQVLDAHSKQTVPFVVESKTLGISPEYQPVAAVPHRLDPTALVGI